MATSQSYINYICEQLEGIGEIRYQKMFGEYIVYVNDKPIITVCDDTAYIKKLDCIESLMKESNVGCPYEGAKEHYILDIDEKEFSRIVVSKVEEVTPLPKKKK